MARNLRQYLVDENTPVSPEWVRRVFGDIDARIDALEQIKADWQAAVDILTSQALLRIDEALRPAFDELQQLASVGAFFTATSASDVAVGTGLKTFIVDEPRKNFVPAEYVVVSSASAPDIGMAGRLVSYDPETGELVVNVELASGTGSRSDWRISVGTPPDLTHAGRTDNPHGVTWDQVGAAAAVHGHQIADVSGLEAALAGKLDNTVAAFADRINTLNENTAPSGAEFVPCSDGQKVALSNIDKFEPDFISGALSYTSGANTDQKVAHGLGQVPRFFGGFIKCITAEHGYAVGDVIQLGYDWPYGSLYATSSEVGYLFRYKVFKAVIRPPSSGAFQPTSANWELYLWASK